MFLTLLGKAIRVVKWGLDPVGWVISVAIGLFSLLIGVILKFIPLEKILPGGGSKELTIKEFKKMSTTRLRSGIHNSKMRGGS